MINIRKRGKVYQYQFETARVNGKRTQKSKSGFRTKNEAYLAGQKAYDIYINGGVEESYMSYGDYLDCWIENYCEVNLKHSTLEEYQTIVRKYLKPDLGKYILKYITGYQLNKYLIEACSKYDYSPGYIKNFQKVIKSSFRDACNVFGYIEYDPAATLRMPKMDYLKKVRKAYLHTERNR